VGNTSNIEARNKPLESRAGGNYPDYGHYPDSHYPDGGHYHPDPDGPI